MIKIIDNQTIAASGVFICQPIDLRKYSGAIGVTAVVTGTGTCKIEYFVPTVQSGMDVPESYSGYIEPTGVSDIGAGLTVGSYTATFTPIPSDFIQIRVTETGAVNPVTITLNLVIKSL